MQTCVARASLYIFLKLAIRKGTIKKQDHFMSISFL